MFGISEYLEIDSKKRVVRCRKCGSVLCSYQDQWKKNVRVNESPLRKAGPKMSDSITFILREFLCPSCGTLFDVEVSTKNAKLTIDEIKLDLVEAAECR